LVSPLDHRLEAATGHDIDTLWAYRDRGVLDEQHAQLVDRHRKLARPQTGVIFHLRLLNRLSNGEFEVDGVLLTRIDRTVDQLKEAADRGTPLPGMCSPPWNPSKSQQRPSRSSSRLTTRRRAARHRRRRQALRTPADRPDVRHSRLRHPHPPTKLRRLEDVGLVAQDTGHPVHAGPPVAFTDAGRAALFAAHRAPTTQTPKVPVCPGTSPSTPAQRR
jgi:hypothetical protein